MKKYLCFIISFGLSTSLFSFGQEYLTSEEISSKLDSKVYDIVLTTNKENTIISSQIRQEYGSEIVEFHQKVKKHVYSLIEDDNFSQVTKNSVLSNNIDKIYADILCSSILSPDGDRILETIIRKNEDTRKMVRYVALRLKSFLEKGKEIEKINPPNDQKTIIQNQYKELKDLIYSLAMKELDVPEEYIKKAIDINFKRYEVGPDSVMQLWAKRPFSKETFINIKSEIHEAANSVNDTTIINPISDDMPEDIKRVKLDQFNFHMSLNFVNKLNQIIVKEYKTILAAEGIDENLRERFKPSEDLAQLQKWYRNISNNMDNWRYKE